MMATPLELLTPREDYVPTFLSPYWTPFLWTSYGLGSVFLYRLSKRLPLWSGIHMYAIMGAGGFLFGTWRKIRRDEFHAERDAIMRHYVELHPEDFPPPERKKFAEVFQEWVPIR